MSEDYIRNNFEDIKKYACIIEKRIDDSDLTKESLIEGNANILEAARKHKVNYLLIDDKYDIDVSKLK